MPTRADLLALALILQIISFIYLSVLVFPASTSRRCSDGIKKPPPPAWASWVRPLSALR